MAGNDEYTKSLLHCDGEDGSTDFIDNAVGGSHAYTAYGDAQIDTAQSKFGGASAYFDGSGDYVLSDDDDDLSITDDYTIDFWIRFASLPSYYLWVTPISRYENFSNQWYVRFRNNPEFTSGWEIQFNHFAAGAFYLSKEFPTLSIDTWYHIAIVIEYNNVVRVYCDGTLVGSEACLGESFGDFNAGLQLGREEPTYGRYFNGWLDEVRISNGIARWTEGFTPPDEAYWAEGPTCSEECQADVLCSVESRTAITGIIGVELPRNILNAYLRAEEIPSAFYLALFNDTVQPGDTLADLAGEPSGNGYARQQIERSTDGWLSLAKDTGDYVAVSKEVAFVGTGPGWGPVSCLVLTDTPSGDGKLLGYRMLETPVSMIGGDFFPCLVAIKLR